MEESEGTIEESEERYRDLFDNVNDGIAAIGTAEGELRIKELKEEMERSKEEHQELHAGLEHLFRGIEKCTRK